jgi:hypothetical protein
MRLYPDVPQARNRTIAGDAAVVALVILFAWLGVKVHDNVAELSGLGRGVRDAGAAVQGGFRSAGDAVGGAPVVGGQLRDALRDAGSGTGGSAVDAGRAGERSAYRLANLLGWLTFLLPTVLLLSRVLPPRVAQARRLTAAQRVLLGGDERLLARRAAFGLPYATLLRHTRDPLGDLQAGRHDALVAAVLEDAGLLTRTRRGGSTTDTAGSADNPPASPPTPPGGPAR